MQAGTIDAALAAAGSKATYTGSGMVLSGWLFSSEFAVFIGIVIGVAGFLVNWYYRHKLTTVEIKFKLDELHLKQEQNERDKVEHNFKMQTFRQRAEDHKDCFHEEGVCKHTEN
jgi:hypothetical protein